MGLRYMQLINSLPASVSTGATSGVKMNDLPGLPRVNNPGKGCMLPFSNSRMISDDDIVEGQGAFRAEGVPGAA